MERRRPKKTARGSMGRIEFGCTENCCEDSEDGRILQEREKMSKECRIIDYFCYEGGRKKLQSQLATDRCYLSTAGFFNWKKIG